MSNRILQFVVICAAFCMVWLPDGAFSEDAETATSSEIPSEPDNKPFLMIDTEMHVGPLTRVAASADGRIVATGSADKSIRFFSGLDGSLLQKIFLPLGDDRIGVITGLALSADGRIAYAGTVSFDTAPSLDLGSLYLINVAEGRLLGRVKNLPNAPADVQLSPDGRFLGLVYKNLGFQILDGANGVLLYENMDRPVQAIAVHDDRFVVVGPDAFLRVFDAGGDSIVETSSAQIRDAGEPFSAALSPDGSSLAVGYLDRSFVDIISLDRLQKQRLQPPAGLTDGNLGAVAWTEYADGPVLVAGGTLQTTRFDNVLVAWQGSGFSAASTVTAGTDAITHLVPAGDSAVLFGSADPGWGRVIVEGAGGLRLATARWGERFDFRNVWNRRFEISADGSKVVFQDSDITRPIIAFDLDELELSTGDDVVETDIEGPDIVGVTSLMPVWRNTSAPLLGEQLLPLDQTYGERVLAADVTPDRQRIVLGTDFYLRLYAADSTVPLAVRRLQTAAWAVAVAPESHVLVAAHGDGTIRWYSLEQDRLLEELASVFIHPDGMRWVAWTDEGDFAHSDFGGVELVGYQLNGSAAEPTGRWVGFDSLYDVYYHPDRVAAATSQPEKDDAASDTLAVALTRSSGLAGNVGSYCPTSLHPREVSTKLRNTVSADEITMDGCRNVTPVTLGHALGPDNFVGDQVPSDTRAVDMLLDLGDSAEKVETIDIFVNKKNAGRYDVPTEIGHSAILLNVPLTVDQAKVKIRLNQSSGLSSEEGPFIFRRAAAEIEEEPEKTLHILGVGIDQYSSAIGSLERAVADATSVTDRIRNGASGIYDKVAEPILLLDADATENNFEQAIEELADGIEPQDGVILYFAGHGYLTPGGEYAFLTADVGSPENAETKAGGLSNDDIVRAVGRLNTSNLLLILDTCYAGAYQVEGPSRLAHDIGYLTFAASASYEEALDNPPGYENGLFATTMLEGLNGRAAMDGVVDALILGMFLQKEVKVEAKKWKHNQSAVLRSTSVELAEFPLAEVDEDRI